MRYLLVCHNVGGEMRGIAAWLAAQPQNQVMLAMDRRNPAEFGVANIERVLLKKSDARPARDGTPEYLIAFMRKAEKTIYSLRSLASRKTEPDIILTFSADGGAFGLGELFPAAFLVNYLVSISPFSKAEIRAVNLLQTMQASEAAMNFAFNAFAAQSLPRAFRSGIKPAPLPVDTAWFAPAIKPAARSKKPLVVFWLKSLSLAEFGGWLNGVIAFVLRNAAVSVVIFAPNTGVVNAARHRLASLPESAAARVQLRCYPDRQWRRDVFSSASLFLSPCPDMHLYLAEAMSCGCPPMLASFPPHLRPGVNCLPYASKNLFDTIEAYLAQPELLAGIAARARAYALEFHAVENVVPQHIAAIEAAARQKY